VAHDARTARTGGTGKARKAGPTKGAQEELLTHSLDPRSKRTLGLNQRQFIAKTKKNRASRSSVYKKNGGADGTRTRGLPRDRRTL
jgi:hypothetical protein